MTWLPGGGGETVGPGVQGGYRSAITILWGEGNSTQGCIRHPIQSTTGGYYIGVRGWYGGEQQTPIPPREENRNLPSLCKRGEEEGILTIYHDQSPIVRYYRVNGVLNRRANGQNVRPPLPINSLNTKNISTNLHTRVRPINRKSSDRVQGANGTNTSRNLYRVLKRATRMATNVISVLKTNELPPTLNNRVIVNTNMSRTIIEMNMKGVITQFPTIGNGLRSLRTQVTTNDRRNLSL